MRFRASLFLACTLIAACTAFGAESGEGAGHGADAGGSESGADATTRTAFTCPPDSLYCLDFDGPARGAHASVELAAQTPIAKGAVLAAPVPGAEGGGNAARFVLPASANAFVEFAAKTFVLPVTDDVQIEADVLVDDPHVSLDGNALTLLMTAANVLGESRVEAKIDGTSDAALRIDLYARDSSGSPGDPSIDDKAKVGVPYGSWVHLTLQARLAGTKSDANDAGVNIVTTDRGARLVREMKRNPSATKTSFIFGIAKSIATPVDITVTFDNVTVTKLP